MAREVLGVAGAVVGGIVAGPTGAMYGFTIGSIAGGIIDPPNFDGPKLGDAAVQTSRDGLPIPIVWGTSHVVGNLIAMNPIVETTKKVSTGKGGSTTTETTRTRTFAIGVCRGIDGPITGILRCWENNKLVYDVRSGSTFPEADNTAFEAATTVYLGDETQNPDPDLEANSGVGNTPAYRGLAYIVWQNKDITNFGSSIPSYRFEITVSGSAGVFGTTATQDGFSAGDVSHPHPFAGQAFGEWTKSSVFKSDIWPTFLDNQHVTFGIDIPGKIGLFWYSSKVGIEAYIYSQPTGTANQLIASDFITLDSAGDGTVDWTPLDWYCVTCSYSKALNVYKVSYVNLTRNDEVIQTGTVTNNLDVDFAEATAGKFASVVTWGAQDVSTLTSPPDKAVFPWEGALGHSFVHNKYIDLDVAANRRLFSGLDGITNLGFQGEVPFGEQALIYLPTGHPSDQLGSADIGDWDADFFFDGVSAIVAGTPPTAGSGPTIDTTGSTSWETWFGTPFSEGFNRPRMLYRQTQVIPDAGIAIAFTVPNTTKSYKVEFAAVLGTWSDGTVTGSINQTVGDYTSVPTHTWGTGGKISGGVNNPGLDIDLVPGYTYFFNVRNDTPATNNLLRLQVFVAEQ